MKKKIKKTEPTALATGVFKKRKWPWLLMIAGALCPLLPLAFYANDFFGGKCPYCERFLQHLQPYASFLNTMFYIFIAVVVVSLFLMVFPKRSLIVTACKIVFKKGRKETRVPFNAIDRIDIKGRDCIVVSVSKQKFKFKKLKNRKEIYDALILGVQKNGEVAKEIQNISAGPDRATSLSLLTEGKIRYFKSLLNKGAITEKQFANYVEKALETK